MENEISLNQRSFFCDMMSDPYYGYMPEGVEFDALWEASGKLDYRTYKWILRLFYSSRHDEVRHELKKLLSK